MLANVTSNVDSRGTALLKVTFTHLRWAHWQRVGHIIAGGGYSLS